jgi:hypothetical protein
MAKKKDQIITIREFISQKDIDELLESAFVEQAEAADELELELSDLAETTTFVSDSYEEDQRLISNDDIEALFKGANAMGGGKAPASTDDVASLVSQSDIDALLSGRLDEPAPLPPESKPEDDIGAMISQSDIDALLKGAMAADDVPEPALPVDDGMVSQSDIDALLKGAMGADDVPEPASSVSDGMVSQSDIDALLGGTQNPPENSGASGVVSQSDIDDLLGGDAKDAFTGEGTFEPKERNEDGDVVSQADIDALLLGALAAEEEASAWDEADVNERAVPQSEIDNLLGASLGAAVNEDKQPEPESVILAEDTEIALASMPAPRPSFRPWYKRKVYQMSAMAALAIIISASVLLFKPQSPDTVPKPVVLSFAIPKIQSQVAPASVPGNTNLALPGFLVLAPADNSDTTCLTADMLIVFSDTATVKMIKDNEGFVRNIIYGVINDALLSGDKSAVDRAKLAESIRAALGHVVQKEMIQSVSFGKFEVI